MEESEADDVVGPERVELIDSGSSALRFGAMRDQDARALAFERRLRWARLRHGLIVDDTADTADRLDAPAVVDLRQPFVTSTEVPEARRLEDSH